MKRRSGYSLVPRGGDDSCFSRGGYGETGA